MAKAAHRYDFYLPITFNDGRPIADTTFDAVERRLLARFGGVTTHQRDFPLRGMWRARAQVYVDQVIVMAVLDFRIRGSARFVAQLKRDLLHDFDQLEMLITESKLWVH
jgi:hypothetical protein